MNGLLHPATISYLAGALAFAVLSVLLLTTWRGRLRGFLLVQACALSAVWALAAAWDATSPEQSISAFTLVLEQTRSLAWFLFLSELLPRREKKLPRYLLAGFSSIAVFLIIANDRSWTGTPITGLIYGSFLASAIIGLSLTEQLYRNTAPDHRWAIKYLCIGLAGLFGFDLFLYSDALLFRFTDAPIWSARGLGLFAIAPLIAVTAARNPDWKLDVFVSRRVVFYSASLLGSGAYLLVLAAAGYWLRQRGGDWSNTLLASLIFAGLLGLASLLASGRMRAELRVFLNKHFFNYKYDYREQWLRFSQTLAKDESTDISVRSIRAVAELIDANHGVLWFNNSPSAPVEERRYSPMDGWNLHAERELAVQGAHPLCRFLREKEWVIDLRELRSNPTIYNGLILPDQGFQQARFIVPLFHNQELTGWLNLGEPQAELHFNWEDSDLLKIAAQQVATYLAQWQTDLALNEARQFEGFTRMSTFVVHDLKNLVGQLSLLVRNAEKHKHKPEFVDDMVNTVSNSVSKMTRLLEQLKTGRFPGTNSAFNLAKAIQEAVKAKQGGHPTPIFHAADTEKLSANVEKERLISVLGHLIQNAQDATPEDGQIELRLYRQQQRAIIEIRDNGCGMDADFIQQRYFRPFDTTKGHSGMGIGAYEARHFARSAGGDLFVESQTDTGTTVRLCLPIAAEIKTEQASAEQNPPS